ncbi:MAG: cytidylate kinase-like family protein, partial [Anaerolineae bacterium]|nr:cytidylate kinase-like family protein [Anaerolineae bacterium]
HVWREDVQGLRSVETIDIDEKAALNLVQRAIRAAYEAGNMVIVGRGGMLLLRGKPDVLHVRIEAHLEDRIQRVKHQLKHQRKAYGENIELRREAQDLIANHDHASAAYIQEFYRSDWNNPLLYDLTINTSEIDLETASDIIVERVNVLKSEIAG